MSRYDYWKEQVRISGITDFINGILYLRWSASEIGFKAYGDVVAEFVSGVSILCKSAYIGVFIDGSSKLYKKIRIEQGQKCYTIYSGKEKKIREIRLVKLTEEQYADAGISVIRAEGKIEPLEEKERKILFVGDSITAGYGVDGTNGVSGFTTEDEDATKGYAYMTARKLEAEARIIACSGSGIISKWISQEQEYPAVDGIIPKIFPYTQKYSPSLIVCYLGTNDASYTRKLPEREREFEEQYSRFVFELKKKFPTVPVFLLYGAVERSLCRSVEKVACICGVHYLELPEQDEKDGLGTSGHPGEITQRKISNILCKSIQETMLW